MTKTIVIDVKNLGNYSEDEFAYQSRIAFRGIVEETGGVQAIASLVCDIEVTLKQAEVDTAASVATEATAETEAVADSDQVKEV